MGDARLSLDEILLSLKGVKRSGDQYQAQCPAHEDRTASLSVTRGANGGVLLKCFAGCAFDRIIAALGFSSQQLSAPKSQSFGGKRTLICTYDYKDAAGVLRYQVLRYSENGRKTFVQRQPDGAGDWIWKMRGVKLLPNRLNELKECATVYIVEGEKDADNLWRVGLPATTNTAGAGKWRDSYSDTLKSVGVQRAILLPDNDD